MSCEIDVDKIVSKSGATSNILHIAVASLGREPNGLVLDCVLHAVRAIRRQYEPI